VAHPSTLIAPSLWIAAGCPILRAFVSCEGWGFRRFAISHRSELRPILSAAYPREYFYEYSATNECVSVSRGAFRRCGGRDMETGPRARSLAGWARGCALGDGVSGCPVAAARVPSAYTRITAHSGRVPRRRDPPPQMPAKTMRCGARCAILIGCTAIRNVRIQLKPHDMFFSNRSKIACLRARFAHVSRSKNHESGGTSRASRFTNHQSRIFNR